MILSHIERFEVLAYAVDFAAADSVKGVSLFMGGPDPVRQQYMLRRRSASHKSWQQDSHRRRCRHHRFNVKMRTVPSTTRPLVFIPLNEMYGAEPQKALRLAWLEQLRTFGDVGGGLASKTPPSSTIRSPMGSQFVYE